VQYLMARVARFAAREPVPAALRGGGELAADLVAEFIEQLPIPGPLGRGADEVDIVWRHSSEPCEQIVKICAHAYPHAAHRSQDESAILRGPQDVSSLLDEGDRLVGSVRQHRPRYSTGICLNATPRSCP